MFWGISLGSYHSSINSELNNKDSSFKVNLDASGPLLCSPPESGKEIQFLIEN